MITVFLQWEFDTQKKARVVMQHLGCYGDIYVAMTNHLTNDLLRDP